MGRYIPPDLEGTGTLSQFGKIGEAKQWSPTLLLKYFFMAPEAKFRPFVGIGVTRVWFCDAKITNGSFENGLTGWTGGYLMGTPIAGYLLEAGGGGQDGLGGVDVYRPAIFYAGGVATLGSIGVIVARLVTEKRG